MATSEAHTFSAEINQRNAALVIEPTRVYPSDTAFEAALKEMESVAAKDKEQIAAELVSCAVYLGKTTGKPDSKPSRSSACSLESFSEKAGRWMLGLLLRALA